MGEITESLINGEFDYVTGEYLGNAVGYPRTYNHKRYKFISYFEKRPTSKANLFITNKCKDMGFIKNNDKIKLVSKFLNNQGYKKLPRLSCQYKIIYNQYKDLFQKFLTEQINKK